MRVSRVAVVGYGIAGATVAALLAEQGHRVEVFERSAHGAAGSGLLLQPSGVIVLDRIGVLDEVRRQAEPIEEVDAFAGRRRIARLVYAELGRDVRGLGLERPVLFGVLDRLARRAGAQVTMSSRIATVTSDGEHATVREETGRSHGPFDLLIGADGLDSVTRRAAGLERWSHRYRWGALWAVGPSGGVRRRLHMVTRGTQELIGLLPLGPDRCNFFWSERLDRYGRTRAAGLALWRARVLDLCPEAEPVIAGVREFDDLTPTAYGHVVTSDPPPGPFVLIGDAAHAMSPHTGQGVNLALIDAYVLADAIARSADTSSARERYRYLRHRQLRFYAWLTLVMTPLFQSDGRALGLVRDIGLPIVERLPYVRYRMTLAMSGLSAGFRGGRVQI